MTRSGEVSWGGRNRLAGLRRFAAAITLLNVAGYGFLGFEPSLAQPLVALAVGYFLELSLEALGAWSEGRRARFRGGLRALVDYLLPAHITALAVSMLLYPNERLGPIAFAVSVALVSKAYLRVPLGGGRSAHALNPSNTGIAVTLILFPWVGITPPYMFTENLGSAGDWLLFGAICVAGGFLNARYTHRLPLIAAWLGGFVLQAFLRHRLLDASLTAALGPATGMAFLLFTMYMLTDPATTPSRARSQVVFGASVAAVYGALMVAHVVFGLFFSLAIVCSVRGAWMLALALRARSAAPVLAAGRA